MSSSEKFRKTMTVSKILHPNDVCFIESFEFQNEEFESNEYADSHMIMCCGTNIGFGDTAREVIIAYGYARQARCEECMEFMFNYPRTGRLIHVGVENDDTFSVICRKVDHLDITSTWINDIKSVGTMNGWFNHIVKWDDGKLTTVAVNDNFDVEKLRRTLKGGVLQHPYSEYSLEKLMELEGPKHNSADMFRLFVNSFREECFVSEKMHPNDIYFVELEGIGAGTDDLRQVTRKNYGEHRISEATNCGRGGFLRLGRKRVYYTGRMIAYIGKNIALGETARNVVISHTNIRYRAEGVMGLANFMFTYPKTGKLVVIGIANDRVINVTGRYANDIIVVPDKVANVAVMSRVYTPSRKIIWENGFSTNITYTECVDVNEVEELISSYNGNVKILEGPC